MHCNNVNLIDYIYIYIYIYIYYELVHEYIVCCYYADSLYFSGEVRVYKYRHVSNIRRTLVGNKIVDNSDVIGASPVGAAPTTSSLST